MAGAVFLDLAAFYDSIQRDKLLEAAGRWGFPTGVLRLGLEMYAGPRHLQAGSFGSHPVWARRGIMPGCSLCTSLAKLAVLEAMLSTVSQWPRVTIDIFIDDLTFNAVGGRQQVTQDIGEAAESFAEKIRPMGCEVAPAKTAVVGSDAETARALRLAVGGRELRGAGGQDHFLGS